MFKYIKTLLKNTKQSLFTFNNEPFSKFSIILIILLDVFLFITISKGISSERKMSPTVSVQYPYTCKNHFNPKYEKKVWNSTTLSHTYSSDSFPFNQYSSFETINVNEYYSSNKIEAKDDLRVSKVCRELYEKTSAFASTKTFKKNKALLKKLKNDKRKVLSDITNMESRYNTALFEKSANVENSSLEKTKKKYYSLLNKEKSIDLQIKKVKKVESYSGYKEYVSFINKNVSSFKKEYESYRFWQPFYAFLYLLKFTLPLLLIFFILYRFTSKVGTVQTVVKRLLKLISSHIIFITLLPIFFDVLYLIYHIIPHRFLENIIAFLYKFGAIFLGYYFLMFIGIVFFGMLIFFIQKGVSKREKLRRELKEKELYINAFNKNECPNCRNKVNYNSQKYCGFCAKKVNRTCMQCKEETPCDVRYCINCGE